MKGYLVIVATLAVIVTTADAYQIGKLKADLLSGCEHMFNAMSRMSAKYVEKSNYQVGYRYEISARHKLAAKVIISTRDILLTPIPMAVDRILKGKDFKSELDEFVVFTTSLSSKIDDKLNYLFKYGQEVQNGQEYFTDVMKLADLVEVFSKFIDNIVSKGEMPYM